MIHTCIHARVDIHAYLGSSIHVHIRLHLNVHVLSHALAIYSLSLSLSLPLTHPPVYSEAVTAVQYLAGGSFVKVEEGQLTEAHEN